MQSTMFSPGDILNDRYIIASFIARGGSGVVYLAEDMKTRTPVVIKSSRDLLGLRETTAISHEKVMYAALHDVPRIPKIQEFFTANRRHVFVLPYLGKSMRDIFLTRGRLNHAEACRMGVTMLETLEGMHRRGVLHLDIKPDNILYDGSYHLTDFGSCRFMTGKLDRFFGTPAFTSVHIDGGGSAGKSDDYESLMYSICAVVGELPWINEEWHVIDGRLKYHKKQNRRRIGKKFPVAFKRAWRVVKERTATYEEMKQLMSLAVLQAETPQAGTKEAETKEEETIEAETQEAETTQIDTT